MLPLPSAYLRPHCGAGPCPLTLWGGRPAGRVYTAAPLTRSVSCPSRGWPGSASQPLVHCRDRETEWATCLKHETRNWSTWHLPVLDVFTDNEEIRLDEPLDDLAVPLFTSRQFPGDRHRLAKDQNKSTLIHCDRVSKCLSKSAQMLFVLSVFIYSF